MLFIGTVKITIRPHMREKSHIPAPFPRSIMSYVPRADGIVIPLPQAECCRCQTRISDAVLPSGWQNGGNSREAIATRPIRAESLRLRPGRYRWYDFGSYKLIISSDAFTPFWYNQCRCVTAMPPRPVAWGAFCDTLLMRDGVAVADIIPGCGNLVLSLRQYRRIMCDASWGAAGESSSGICIMNHPAYFLAWRETSLRGAIGMTRNGSSASRRGRDHQDNAVIAVWLPRDSSTFCLRKGARLEARVTVRHVRYNELVPVIETNAAFVGTLDRIEQ